MNFIFYFSHICNILNHRANCRVFGEHVVLKKLWSLWISRYTIDRMLLASCRTVKKLRFFDHLPLHFCPSTLLSTRLSTSNTVNSKALIHYSTSVNTAATTAKTRSNGSRWPSYVDLNLSLHNTTCVFCIFNCTCEWKQDNINVYPVRLRTHGSTGALGVRLIKRPNGFRTKHRSPEVPASWQISVVGDKRHNDICGHDTTSGWRERFLILIRLAIFFVFSILFLFFYQRTVLCYIK